MTRRNMWLGGGLVIVAAAAATLALTHNSDKTTTPYGSTAATSQKATTSSAQIVNTKTDSSQGDYLADAMGMPLYTYGPDTSGVSNCSGTCLVNWPIYAPTSSPASLPTNVTIITRSDSKAQYAYKSMPLYFFSGDGNTPTGDGVSNFHLAKP